MLRTPNEVASIRGTRQYRGLQSQRAPPGAPWAPWVHNAMKIGGSLRAVWITIFALGLRCESQGGPGLVVVHYNAYELPSKGSWAGLCPPWASVGNRLFSGPLTKLVPNRARPALWMGRGGWPSGRILVIICAFEPKPRCRGTRAAFGLHAVLATCPVFAFWARNPLFLGLKMAVGISIALKF